MFRKLHPEKAGWNLSLVNLAVTNMAETAGNSKTANGRDIGNMFKRQEGVLKEFRVVEQDDAAVEDTWSTGVEDVHQAVGEDEEEEEAQDDWDAEEDDEDGETCEVCGVRLPSFAMVAHRRFHSAD
jgi:DNA polymerase iota